MDMISECEIQTINDAKGTKCFGGCGGWYGSLEGFYVDWGVRGSFWEMVMIWLSYLKAEGMEMVFGMHKVPWAEGTADMSAWGWERAWPIQETSFLCRLVGKWRVVMSNGFLSVL